MRIPPTPEPRPGRRPSRRRAPIVLLALAASLLLGAAGGCGSSDSHPDTTAPMSPPHNHRQAVREANLNYAWPFKVDHGTIACRSTAAGPLLLFSAPNGRTYALNELAENRGYPAVDPVGNGFSLGVIIGDTFKLCPLE